MSDQKLRAAAISLYTPPFKYTSGYIFDANNEMVADDDSNAFAMQVRGWGRISYLDDAEKLQDTVGALLAEALTKHWTALSEQPAEQEPYLYECKINSVHFSHTTEKPPEDAYDEGTLIALYTHQQPKVKRLSDEALIKLQCRFKSTRNGFYFFDRAAYSQAIMDECGVAKDGEE